MHVRGFCKLLCALWVRCLQKCKSLNMQKHGKYLIVLFLWKYTTCELDQQRNRLQTPLWVSLLNEPWFQERQRRGESLQSQAEFKAALVLGLYEHKTDSLKGFLSKAFVLQSCIKFRSIQCLNSKIPKPWEIH